MKFLIENYASAEDTQCLYFAHDINMHEEHSAKVWNSTSSIYDVLDTIRPDYFISHIFKLSKDVVHYMKHAESKMKLLVSVESASDAIIESAEKAILNQGINCAFFFGSRNVKTKKIRFVRINHAYDSNLQTQNTQVDYSIDEAIFIDSKDDVVLLNKEISYHYISNNKELDGVADIVLPENSMYHLYKNYDRIIFRNIKDVVPQSFFDAIMCGNKVYYESNDDNVHESMKKLFKQEKSLNYNDNDKLEDFTNLKSYVKEKHSNQNRTKTLLSQLPKD